MVTLRQANKWMITLYDGLNRPVQTGLLLNSFNNKSFTDHQTAADVSSAYPFGVTNQPQLKTGRCSLKLTMMIMQICQQD
jgi:hypothetical protein